MAHLPLVPPTHPWLHCLWPIGKYVQSKLHQHAVNIAPCKHALQLTDLPLGAVFHCLMMVVVLVRCAGFHGISYKS